MFKSANLNTLIPEGEAAEVNEYSVTVRGIKTVAKPKKRRNSSTRHYGAEFTALPTNCQQLALLVDI